MAEANTLNERTLHRQLYREVPTMRCISGCTDCCGPVPITKYEADRLGVKGAVTPTDENGKCVFSLEGSCSIYEIRPFLCRLFGTVKDLPCPHGVMPAIMMNAGQGFVLLQRYKTAVQQPNADAEFHEAIRQGKSK